MMFIYSDFPQKQSPDLSSLVHGTVFSPQNQKVSLSDVLCVN